MPSSRAYAAVSRLVVLAVLGALLSMVHATAAHAAPVGVPVPVGQAGQVVSWGNTASGLQDLPPELAPRFTQIASGGYHSLALTSDGQIHAWGTNVYGQTTLPASLNDQHVTAIAAGANHSLALTGNGQIHAWGYNAYGQTAIPTSLDDQRVTAIAAGGFHSLALTDDGQIHAWGSNGNGETTRPASLDGQRVTAIAAGHSHSLALTDDGQIHAWGSNGNGQITLPTSLNDQRVTAIAVGGYHSLALTDNGQIHAWGRNWNGQTTRPASLNGQHVTAIAAGNTHSLALTDNGQVHAWGNNVNGQTTIPASLNGQHVTAIAAGDNHSLALTDNGQLHAWGYNGDGQTDVPQAPAGKPVTAIAAGFSHSLALDATGAIHAWGNNSSQQTDVPATPAGEKVTAIAAGTYHSLALTDHGTLLSTREVPLIIIDGDGQRTNSPVARPAFPGGERLVAISVGDYDSLVLTDAGTLLGWGANVAGQSILPEVPEGEKVTTISAGGSHSLALTDHGTLLAWGSNGSGQTDVPATPAGEKITTISAGGSHSLALTDHGTLLTWGSNGSGQTDVPATPAGEKITTISAGGSHSLALTDHGTLLTWGSNHSGQTTVSATPPGTKITAIAAGDSHSLAIATPVADLAGDLTPTVTGSGAYGTTLTAVVTGAPHDATTSYQWHTNGQPISGATRATLTLDDDPTLVGTTVTVTATTSQLAHSAVERTSSGTQITNGTQTGTLSITGDPVVDGTLTASTNGLVNDASVAWYQWYVDGEPIISEPNQTFTVPASFLDREITVTAALTAPGYDDLTLTSAPVTVGKATFAPFDITFDGNPKVGHTLTATLEPMPIGFLSAVWKSNGEPITDVTGPSLTLTPDLAGTDLTFTVTATRDGYNDRTETSDTVTIANGTQTGTKPSIEGDAIVDGTLTARLGDVMDDAAVSYQWSADGDPIDDANGDSLELTAAMAGKTITVTTTAVLAGYDNLVRTSTATDPVTKADFTKLDITITGTPKVGETVTADVDVAPTGTLTYTWTADGDPITDATDATLAITPVLAGADLTVTVTATKRGYNTDTATSPKVTITNGTQTGTTPTITGDAVVDSTLTATAGDTMTDADVSYQWSADGDPITDATSTTLTVAPAMVGKTITVTTTATLAGYNDLVRTSAATGPVTKADFAQLDVTITGTTQVGHTVAAQVDHAPTGTLSYVWAADGDPITDANGDNLAITPDLAGAELAVTVTVTRDGYTDRSETSDAVTVAHGTQSGTKPTITGDAIVDGTLTVELGEVMDDAAVSFQWSADGDPITGANGTSLVLTPGLVGKTITVTTTASLAGYDNLVRTSTATDAVTKADFTKLDVTITGTAQVGETVTADVDVAPTGTLTYVWAADGDPITGSGDDTLAITPDLAGADLTVTVTATRDGYTTSTATSPQVTVANGTQTGTAPSISGTPVVDGTLTATPGDTMDGATVTYQWYADGDPITGATNQTLTLTPDLVGLVITVTTTTRLAGYNDLALTVDNATAPVAKAVFADPEVTVTGTAKAGESLTTTTTATPTPESVTYAWKRGATVVGTDASYQLTDDDEGHEFTVTATLTRAGYENATATATTAVVATRKAPSITLGSGRDNLRLGQQTRITWTSNRATTVTGDWTNTTLSPNGTAQVKPTATGRQTYTITATNANGTTTATTTIAVALPRTTFNVTTNKKKVRATGKYTVRIRGLAPREKFTVRQGKNRATGTAGPKGNAKVRMTAPKRNKATKVKVRVIGSLKDRTGQTRIRVQPHRITVKTAYRQVRASDPQVVTVTGLAKREKVTLRYRGRVIHVGRATHRGVLTHRFKVGTVWGTDTVRARAHRTDRVARTTFTVGRRCADGIWRCP